MAIEMCPGCREQRAMTVTSTTRTVSRADGTEMEVRTDTFHCADCRRFVRSEETDRPASRT